MLDNYENTLQYVFLNNTVEAYLHAVGTALVVWGALWLFRSVILRRLRVWAAKTDTDLDNMLVEIFRSFRTPFYLVLAFGAGSQFLAWPETVATVGKWLAIAVIVYTVIHAITKIVSFFFSRFARQKLQEDASFDPSVIKLMNKGATLAIWVVAALLIAQNMGYNITALVAGLGIGGLAVAFALQSVLSDMFASFSIYLDKPFQTGDFIVVGENMGTVTYIGLKSTRLQSLWGEEVVISNKELTEVRIQNYKGMESRRVRYEFGVTYDTPSKKLRKIPEILKEIIDGFELMELDRAHFKGFGDSSLNFEAMITVNSSEYAVFMDLRQELNLQLKERLEKEKVEFAFPTRTVYLVK